MTLSQSLIEFTFVPRGRVDMPATTVAQCGSRQSGNRCSRSSLLPLHAASQKHDTILNEVICPLLLSENVHFAFKILHFAT